MWSNTVRQHVGLANGLASIDPMVEGRKIMEALLNVHASESERSRAIDQMRIALDSLILDLEA